MAPFSATALPPESPLFRGRQAELARLKQICQDDVTAYTVIFGGHQNGKTSLLFQLEAALQGAVNVCRVDFQLIKGASPDQTFAFLAEQIAQVLPLAPDYRTVTDAPSLLAFLSQTLGRGEIPRLALLLDELGALPSATRQALANALRSFFHTRLIRPALAKLQIIFSGGIELYDLVVTEASSLHNICEEIYLADLSEEEAAGLVTDGLQSLGIAPEDTHRMSQAIYAQVSGHPYLTQRIGGLLVGYVQRGEGVGPAQIAQAVRQITQHGDSLLRQIQNDLREHKLETAARRLLSDPPRFTRLDEDMLRLELIGLAKPSDPNWAPRNPLLADVIREQLGIWPHPSFPVGGNAVSDNAPFDALILPDSSAEPVSQPQPSATEAGLSRAATHRTRPQQTIDRRTLSSEQRRVMGWSILLPPANWLWLVRIGIVLMLIGGSALAIVRWPGRSGAPEAAIQTLYQNNLIPELVAVPAGVFLMGSSDADTQANSDEKPQHNLTLPDYWIGKTEVTNAQFRPFVEGDGYTNQAYWTRAGWEWRVSGNVTHPNYWDDSKWNGDMQPVVGISWFEAVAYCRWLSAQTGHEFRLPSEPEWEKAARGGDGSIWPWGNTWADGRSNSKEVGIGKTMPVGQYVEGASLYGALDMAGNAWEWLATQSGKTYPYVIEDEWQTSYLEQATIHRRIRSGSLYGDQQMIRGASRGDLNPGDRNVDIGMRVVSYSPLSNDR